MDGGAGGSPGGGAGGNSTLSAAFPGAAGGGGTGGTGGAAGTSGSPNGSNGGNSANGGGGGGGGYSGNGFSASSFNNAMGVTLMGGNGGNGGAGGASGGGGGGGSGGDGAGVAATTGSNNNAGTIDGGNGGNGGVGNANSGGNGADGGGLSFATSTNGTSLTNSGTINGGNGGNGGASTGAMGGNGGDGGGLIFTSTASGATSLTNTGTITGGTGGTGGTNSGIGVLGGNGGAAVTLSGNRIIFNNSGTLTGGIAGDTGVGGGYINSESIGGNAITVNGNKNTIINSGTITYGVGINTVPGDAIDLNGSGNTLELHAGSNIIGSVFATGGNNTLTLGGGVNSSFDASGIAYPNSISTYNGFNSVTKTGTSTWTLTGGGGYTAPWTIYAGTLAVDNIAALGNGNVTLNGGTLTGTGSTRIGVGGNYVQAPGSTLLLHIQNISTYDYLELAGYGTASLNGKLNLDFDTTSFTPGKGQQYTVVTTFGGITSVGSLFLHPETNLAALDLSATGALTNDNRDFVVTVDAVQQYYTSLFGGNYLNANQRSVAENLGTFIAGGGTSPLLTALDDESFSPGSLASAFNQLTPLTFASFASSTAFNNVSFTSQQMNNYFANRRGADGTFVSAPGGIDYSGLTISEPDEMLPGLQQLHNQLLAWNSPADRGIMSDVGEPLLAMNGTGQPSLFGSGQNPWNFFVTGNVTLARDSADSSTGTQHTDTTTSGVQLGADYKITPHFLVGGMFGYGHTYANFDSYGDTTVDTYSPAVYASYTNGGWYANALGSYGFDNYTQDRNISISTLTGTAHSSPYGDQITGDLDGGYEFHQNAWVFGPTAGIQYTHLDVNGYTESGLPAADLTVNGQESDSLRSQIGGRVSYAFQDNGIVFLPHLSASWQHEFLDQSRGITSQFDGLGTGSFVVTTPNSSRDSVLADVGFNAQINKTVGVFADYTVQAGQTDYFGQFLQAGVKIAF